MILLDEPELGLHPYAITMLANLIKTAATKTQIIVSTQSALLLDHFDPEDVLVAELEDGATGVRRLESHDLEQWLDEYSLGQLWKRTSSVGDRRVLRILILVEGETEETFVNAVLAPHLFTRGFAAVSAKLMGNARLRSRRGGVRGWPEVQAEILHHLRTDQQIYVTTMVDYYGMPGNPNQANAWPGRHAAPSRQSTKGAASSRRPLRSKLRRNCRIFDVLSRSS